MTRRSALDRGLVERAAVCQPLHVEQIPEDALHELPQLAAGLDAARQLDSMVPILCRQLPRLLAGEARRQYPQGTHDVRHDVPGGIALDQQLLQHGGLDHILPCRR
ncbi:hypothetical protein D9M68_653720 [compost metagenome]